MRSAAKRSCTAGSMRTYFSATAAEMGDENVTLTVDSRGPGVASMPRTASLVLEPTGISLT